MIFQLLATLWTLLCSCGKKKKKGWCIQHTLSKEQAGIRRLGDTEGLLANKAFIFINIRVWKCSWLFLFFPAVNPPSKKCHRRHAKVIFLFPISTSYFLLIFFFPFSSLLFIQYSDFSLWSQRLSQNTPGFQRSGFTEIMALGWEPRFPGLDLTLVPGLYNKSTFFPNKLSVFIVTQLEAIRCWSSEPAHLHTKIRQRYTVKSFREVLSRHDLKRENLQEKQEQNRCTVSYSATVTLFAEPGGIQQPLCCSRVVQCEIKFLLN